MRSPFLKNSALAASSLLLISVLFVKTALAVDDGFDSPEIDPGSISSAVALVVGGALMLTDRLRRKNKKVG